MITFALKFILFEYVFIVCICLLLCLLKVVISLLDKKRQKEISFLKERVKEIIVGKKKWDEKEWMKKKWTLPSLLYVLEVFDINMDNEVWNNLKDFLCDKFLLPWAKKNYLSFFWSRRNRSVRTFLLSPRKEDLPILRELLNDKNFFIRMEAVAATAKIPSTETVALLLENMSKEEPAARFPYRYALLKLPLESLFHVIEVYQTSSNENVRLSCLDIMSQRFILNPIHVIKKDYQAKNPKIRILIVKILGNLSSEEANVDLLLFLNDPSPEVRSEAIFSLGKLKSEKSFNPVVKMLKDENFSVRLQAAFALLKYGKPGRKVLETQDWDLDPKAYEVARYVLTMP